MAEPGFPGGVLWVTPAALDAEASGYFLIPASAPAEAGWRAVDAAEAGKIWGKGATDAARAGDSGDPLAHGHGKPSPNPNPCMCGYDIKEATVGVTLSDTPVGYAPPIGPAATVTIAYNQREDSQPANFNFYNLSPKWTLNWLTYVIDDPTNAGASVSRYLPGGGAIYYSGYVSGTGQFAAQDDDGSILVLASASPVTYRRQLADGSIEVYAQSDGASAYPRHIFLSQAIDPQGNTLSLNYDAQLRLTSLTDAAGRSTTFTYGLSGSPLLVTQITDPFGRFATLAYDASGRLSSITDVLGLISSFGYDANSLVNTLTTPYGVTSFTYTAPGASGPPRFVQVTDPLGYHEREEWLEPSPIPDSDPAATVPAGMPLAPVNQYLTYRDSFYWDRNAYVAAACTPTGGCDYSKARDTHFTHVPNASIKSTTVESVKYPLENRIWYQYPGQTNSIFAGAYQQPIAQGRVLDDATTQLKLTSYDTAGYYKPTQTTDPLGRVTTFAYAANHIDLATITQTVAGGAQATLDQFTWNGQHRPLTHIDAAGQTTSFGYNGAGQLTSVTNALNQKTSFGYNATGDLTSVTNANNLTQASYAYDAFDRVATFTDSEGWQVAYAYDAADRVTSITYPDSTTETWTYNKLDLASYKDRLGRTWSYLYDADRRRTSMTDPANHQSLYAYNPVDELASLTDPNSHITQWAYDVEGRLTTKTYADNSTLAFTYEATTSRLKSTTDALSQVRQLAWAKDDRVTGLTYVGALHATPNVTFAYDPYFPRRTSMTDGTGTTTYAYVPVGSLGALQVQTETLPPANATIAYAYDALGRLATRTVAGQGAESFGYDAIGRMTSHAGDLGAFTLAWLGQTNQIAARTLASSTLATSWSYLANSGDRRLASVTTTGVFPSQSTSFAYTTDAANEVTGLTQTSDAAIAQPASASSQSASYNNLNQLTQLGSQAQTFDADGNLTGDGTRSYTWDAENRLVAIAYPGQGAKATAFAYDGLGRRTQWVSTPKSGLNPVTTNYLWCGERLCQARNGANTVTRGYYAEGEYTPGGFPSANYYAPDRLGSVRRVFTTLSNASYDYDAYGNPLQTTAPATDFGFAGLVANPDSGLDLATRRPYDPTTGRFLSRDPIGEAGDPLGNLYAYVGGDPVGESDPWGLATFQIGGAGSVNLPFGITIPLGGGVAVDSEGHFGLYEYAGGGAQLGAAAEAGLSLQVSNAHTICDLSRGFHNTSAHGGLGLGGSADYFYGQSPHGSVLGGGVTLGAAAGASFSAAYTYTLVQPIW